MLFDRDSIDSALAQINEALKELSLRGRMNIIGGAAIALHDSRRDVTADIDSVLHPREDLVEVGKALALRNGWPTRWLNDSAAQYLPGYGAEIQWLLVRQFSHLDAYVAPLDVLLTMKLRASRQKDVEDIAWLTRQLNISSLEEAEDLVDHYSPGDGLNPKAVIILEAVFATGNVTLN